jgi:surfactin synthase thioesterase subunit
MIQPVICFSHGKESGPWGSKINALAEIARACGWQVESLDYRGIDDPQARIDKLLRWCTEQTQPYALAGSSMGGAVAMAATAQVEPLGVFVMAPAFYVPGYEQWTPVVPKCPVTVVHGWRDEIIPWQNSARFSAGSHATLHLVDGDHRLMDVLDGVGHQFKLFLNSLR